MALGNLKIYDVETEEGLSDHFDSVSLSIRWDFNNEVYFFTEKIRPFENNAFTKQKEKAILNFTRRAHRTIQQTIGMIIMEGYKNGTR